MCRLAAYVGPERSVHELWLAPPHSLEVQSYAPKEMNGALLNADGFGMAWYVDTERTPALYRTTLPLWADENVRRMARHTRTRCAVANVRSATAGMPSQLSNVSPFVDGRWTFSHNGYLGAFREALMRPMREALDDARYGAVIGNTDSEHLSALFMTRLSTLAEGDDPSRVVSDALSHVRDLVRAAGADALLNVVVTDGRWLLASRLAVAAPAPSLYVRARPEGGERSVEIVSEPLDDAGWQAVDESSLLVVSPDLELRMEAL